MSNALFSNAKVVKITLELLKENREWEKRYAGYAKDILKNENKYREGSKLFKVKRPLYIYSSISKVKSKKLIYDLRFAGQSVGEIAVKDGDVTLKVGEKQSLYAFNNFEYSNKEGFSVEWKSPKAREYRRVFRERDDKKTHSKEHRIENWLLAEFGKGTRKKGKMLCNIQPVQLGGKFFQLTTPLSASNHVKLPGYMSERGGGIDILARVKHANFGRDNRFAVIELKDENKSEESQAMTLQQSLAYATFLVCLLRSESGNCWWKILRNRDDGSDIPEELHIDVVTLMPGPDYLSQKGDLSDVKIDKMKAILHPYTLYYEEGKDGLPKRFYGTLKEALVNQGE